MRPRPRVSVAISLTVATSIRIAGEVARNAAGPEWLGWIVTVSGIAQVIGFAIYVALVLLLFASAAYAGAAKT